ncbi:biotin transporter BioY [Rhodobacteraceae bacterium NNCM2]|nr:biotin transporter BioY [Coraliihabitans acroporae]
MMASVSHPVLSEAVLHDEGAGLWLKRAVLVVAGIAALVVSSKISIPMWPSPVPINMATFAVLSIGAAYGPRLGLVTVLGYLLIGAMGFDVFVSSSSENYGLAYMLGGTGGYLFGFAVAAAVLGLCARRGWDRNVLTMALAMLIGNALIYVFGVAWLAHLFVESKGWATVLDWGLWPYLIGDAAKLALAALLLPAIWKLVGSART